MKVFISWSGDLSKRLAEAFRDWLPGVVQAVEPFFSPDDIAKGDRWVTEIASKLEECRVGIFCITRDNVGSPWLVFEAGAISKHLGSTKVCTIFFDLAPTDITGPLTQFQGAVFEKEEIFKVVNTVNEGVEENRLKPAVLKNVFEKWWPDLKSKTEGILAEPRSPEAARQLRTDREILSEVLAITRHLKSSPTGRRNRILSSYVKPVFSSYKRLLQLCVDSDFSVGPAVVLGQNVDALFKHLLGEHRHTLGQLGGQAREQALAAVSEVVASQGQDSSDEDEKD